MAKLTDLEKQKRATDKLQKAYDNLKSKFSDRSDVLSKLRSNARASSPSAADTILRASAEQPQEKSSGFSLLKTGAVIGGIIAGVWYYYHSGGSK